MTPVEQAVHDWLERVVIGLNLCPFAAAPLRAGRLRLWTSHAADEAALLDEVSAELRRLQATPAKQLETTLIAIPQLLEDFGTYTRFLEQVEALLIHDGWATDFQVASFHPAYQFDGTLPDDVSNLTNRAPVPLIHLLREDSVSQAVARHPDVDGIPAANIHRIESLSPAQRAALFPWIVAD